jgi:hypothetical protein
VHSVEGALRRTADKQQHVNANNNTNQMSLSMTNNMSSTAREHTHVKKQGRWTVHHRASVGNTLALNKGFFFFRTMHGLAQIHAISTRGKMHPDICGITRRRSCSPLRDGIGNTCASVLARFSLLKY